MERVAGPPAHSKELEAALQGLITARGKMANCHVALVDAKQFIPGLRTVGFGDVSECPPPPKGSVDLRVVA